MKGDRKRIGQALPRQPADIIGKAAGGKRNLTAADMQALLRVDKPEKADDVIIIVKRFTDAHEHNVGNPLSGILLHLQDLAENFGGSEIPRLAAERGGAERAAHPAPRLC